MRPALPALDPGLASTVLEELWTGSNIKGAESARSDRAVRWSGGLMGTTGPGLRSGGRRNVPPHRASKSGSERPAYGTCTVRGQYAYRTVRELGICGPAQGGQGTSSSSSNSQRFVRELCRRMAPTCATWAQLGAQTGHENPLPLICVPLSLPEASEKVVHATKARSQAVGTLSLSFGFLAHLALECSWRARGALQPAYCTRTVRDPYLYARELPKSRFVPKPVPVRYSTRTSASWCSSIVARLHTCQ